MMATLKMATLKMANKKMALCNMAAQKMTTYKLVLLKKISQNKPVYKISLGRMEQWHRQAAYLLSSSAKCPIWA